MKVEIRYQYDSDAGAIAESVMPTEFRGGWTPDNLNHIPLQDDLLSFGDGDSNVPVFEVKNRLFIWRSPEHLVIQLLVGLLPGADPKTGFVVGS
jgi:hypothetical protein